MTKVTLEVHGCYDPNVPLDDFNFEFFRYLIKHKNFVITSVPYDREESCLTAARRLANKFGLTITEEITKENPNSSFIV